jgi:hypothetical protein
MSATASLGPLRATVSRSEVEDFLYAEAALLDTWSLDDWLLMYEEDAKYEVPATMLPTAISTPTCCSSTTTTRACGLGWRGSTAAAPTRIRALPHQPPDPQCQGGRAG